DSRVMGDPRENFSRLPQQLIHAQPLEVMVLLDSQLLLRRKLAHLQQGINIKSVPFVGRYAARRGVRRGDVTHLLQVGHDVANGGWRKAERMAPGHGPGPDRFGRVDIVLDYRFEDLATAFVELFAHPFHRPKKPEAGKSG